MRISARKCRPERYGQCPLPTFAVDYVYMPSLNQEDREGEEHEYNTNSLLTQMLVLGWQHRQHRRVGGSGEEVAGLGGIESRRVLLGTSPCAAWPKACL